MIDEETRRKLRELSMGEMVEALDLQEADRTSMAVPFDERIRMMVDYAWEAKRASSVRRLVQRARLRFPDAEMGEMIYDGRGIDGVLIREAGTCQFMESASNVVIEGCTGTGKSYLACCLAKQACRMRRSARYVRLPDLLMERDELAATERSNAKILRKYARYEILVLDEWLTEDVNDVDISFLFELIERRYAARSTVLCTQYTPAEWARPPRRRRAGRRDGRSLGPRRREDRSGRRQRPEAARREEIAISNRETGGSRTA